MGFGDHPAPAIMTSEDGFLHVAGEPPNGLIAGSQSPIGDATDRPSGNVVTDPDGLAAIHAETEPEQVETDRPDIGTSE